MKKVWILVAFLCLSVVLVACGPNSYYYDLKTEKIEYKEGDVITIDPFKYIQNKETSSWIKGVSNEQFRTFKRDYRVEFEYRIKNSGDKYQSYQFEGDKYQIVFDTTTFESENVSIEFKLHFIHKEHKDKKYMINFLGVYNFFVEGTDPGQGGDGGGTDDTGGASEW